MAIFKCKMCGGTLNVSDEVNVCECEYCGTAQTLPRLNNEKRNQLFDRANYYRMQNEFDKASVVYENILSEAPDEAEAHWGMCLCRYGIEYVVDPKTKKRIPTCHRTQFKSIFEDPDYLAAIKNSDSIAQNIYRSEAEYIDKVQKGILEISAKEEPFDIFICYKESDNAGNRTTDSVIAQDIYTELTEKGYKVFFARITLEDKLGSAYEPYIFAALNSSKIMLVVGTKPEYFNAVWVKNEWGRYLALIENGQKKNIIPCYRDMNPYDMPEEFIPLQSQDVSKIGYMQDLLRGIEKILGGRVSKAVSNEINPISGNININSLLKRAFMFLEEGKWDNAEEYGERVLDIDPECAQAYLAKLMAELNVKKKRNLLYVDKDFSRMDNFKKAVRFGDTELEELSRQSIYNSAVNAMKKAENDKDFRNARKIFLTVKNFSDANVMADECEEKALIYLYEQAISAMNVAENDQDFRNAVKFFEKIPEYKDSRQKANECEEKALEYLYQLADKDMKTERYAFGSERAAKRYEELSKRFEELYDYKDSKQKMQECIEKAIVAKKEATYQNALHLQEDNKLESLRSAVSEYKRISDYKDSESRIAQCEKNITEIEAKNAILWKKQVVQIKRKKKD